MGGVVGCGSPCGVCVLPVRLSERSILSRGNGVLTTVDNRQVIELGWVGGSGFLATYAVGRGDRRGKDGEVMTAEVLGALVLTGCIPGAIAS